MNKFYSKIARIWRFSTNAESPLNNRAACHLSSLATLEEDYESPTEQQKGAKKRTILFTSFQNSIHKLHTTLSEGLELDMTSFILALNSCIDLHTGKMIHAVLIETGLDIYMSVGPHLLKMYVKFNRFDAAKIVFDSMPEKHVVSWTIMISAYGVTGLPHEALKTFHWMHMEGVLPNSYTLVAVLQACSLTQGVHEERLKALCEQVGVSGSWNVIVATALIGIHGKCRSVSNALTVFEKLEERDTVVWNSVITVCLENDEPDLGLILFRRMVLEGVKPSKITFLKALAAATEAQDLVTGCKIHTQAVEQLLDTDVMVCTALAIMYSRFGNLEESIEVLHRIDPSRRDIVCWNTIISACTQTSRTSLSLSYYRKMSLEGVKPDRGTFASLLSTLSSILKAEVSRSVMSVTDEECCQEVKMILGHVVESGLSCNLIVGNAVLNMHAKSRRLQDAKSTFDWIFGPDIVSWNTMISAYVTEGSHEEALLLFHRMHQDGLRPDTVTSTTLFGAYAESRGLDEACEAMFHEEKNLNFYTVLISTLSQKGLPRDALQVFRYMQLSGLRLDHASLLPVISSCAACAAIKEGRMIHSELNITGSLENSEDSRLMSALVDMYGKCGKLEEAYKTFLEVQRRNAVSWTAVVSAYAQNGHVEEATYLFLLMKLDGALPDTVTFTSLLSMCGHAGLVEDGCRCLGEMSGDYGLRPSWEHYSCVIDLLGRAGWLEEAEYLIENAPCAPNVYVLTALLSACRSHGDVERGERIARKVLQLQPGCSTGYIGLTNIISS